MAVLADEAITNGARKAWDEAVAAPAWHGPPTWLHGDLHPANVVLHEGTLAGVIDFGEMCAGDPATDLSAAWILLPAHASNRLITAYKEADQATVARARGWAVLRALHLLAIGRNGRLGLPGGKPTWEPAGRAALERALTPDWQHLRRHPHVPQRGRNAGSALRSGAGWFGVLCPSEWSKTTVADPGRGSRARPAAGVGRRLVERCQVLYRRRLRSDPTLVDRRRVPERGVRRGQRQRSIYPGAGQGSGLPAVS